MTLLPKELPTCGSKTSPSTAKTVSLSLSPTSDHLLHARSADAKAVGCAANTGAQSPTCHGAAGPFASACALGASPVQRSGVPAPDLCSGPPFDLRARDRRERHRGGNRRNRARSKRRTYKWTSRLAPASFIARCTDLRRGARSRSRRTREATYAKPLARGRHGFPKPSGRAVAEDACRAFWQLCRIRPWIAEIFASRTGFPGTWP